MSTLPTDHPNKTDGWLRRGQAMTRQQSNTASPNARMEIKEFVCDPHGPFSSAHEGADPERKHEANNADADCKPSRNASARHHWPNRIGLRQIG